MMESPNFRDVVQELKSSRSEWDFRQCPRGRERYCWAYEFAREIPSINASYEDDVRELLAKNGDHYAFDKHANWHHEIQIFGSEGELDDEITLEIPFGFPEKPYLSVEHTPYSSDLKLKPFSKVRDAEKMQFADERLKQAENFAHLHIMWTAPDKEIVRSFREWLKTHRPRAPITRRGKSATRLYMADLRALGAWRLQVKRKLTAEIAHRATEQICKQPLFSKLPDWYSAKKRAEAVLATFR
jgi:hypothetical protein